MDKQKREKWNGQQATLHFMSASRISPLYDGLRLEGSSLFILILTNNAMGYVKGLPPESDTNPLSMIK